MTKTRKDNGEGTIFFSEVENKWIAKIQYGVDYNGKPLTKKFASKDKKGKQIVTKKLNEFKKQMLLGEVGTSKVTLNDYIENWLDTYQKPKVKETTFYRDCTVFSSHIKYTIGYKKITDIKTIDIQRLINNEKDIYANKTIEKTYSLLNRVFSRAVILGDVGKNPCMGIVLPTIHSNSIKPKNITEYTIEETDKMRNGIYDSFYTHSKLYRASPSYLILLNTGIRLGELLALTWDKVDFDNNLIKITATQETISGKDKFKKVTTLPKTKSSYRTVVLNKTSLEMIKELKKRNEEQGIESPYIVCNLNGDSFNDNNYRRDFRRFCER